ELAQDRRRLLVPMRLVRLRLSGGEMRREEVYADIELEQRLVEHRQPVVLPAPDRQPRQPRDRELRVRLAPHEPVAERGRPALARGAVVRLLERDDVRVELAQLPLDRVLAADPAVP